MQKPSQAEPFTRTPNPSAKHLVYDLRLDGGDSDRFYAEAARFADLVVDEIEFRAGDALDGYSRHLQGELKEPERSRGEYAIELLTLGLALERYAGAAESTPGWVVEAARELYWLRHRTWPVKPLADRARAWLTRLYLMPRIGCAGSAEARSLADMPRLIEWLHSTGEFEQEAMRLNNWRSFLGTLPPSEARLWMLTATELFAWFEREAARVLGPYTQGVAQFMAGEHTRRGCREDQLFCGKPEVEYHLSMVAAEVMNRGLRAEFESKRHKAVLVPACMRGEHAKSCRARVFGADITCTACDPECTVNRITRRMRTLGARVYLVPHATGFSRWLERWQHEPDTGVAAVACLLNILPGGYEMRARRIASQCVPLDYPGCEKHWRAKGIPTGVNEERLVQIVTGPRG
jgi:hypothetical protein